MKKIICVAVLLAVQAFAGGIVCSESPELCAPFLTGLIIDPSGEGSEIVEISASPDPGGSGFSAQVNFVGSLGAVIGSIATDADPFIDYSFGVINFTSSDLTFSFLFFSPYAGGPFGGLRSSHSSSATDGGVADGSVVVSADALTGFVHNPILDGVDVTSAALGTGCTLAGAPGFSDSCDGFSLLTVPIVSAASGIFGVRIEFTLSPGDALSLNGRVELIEEPGEPIPEPTYAAVVGLALVGLSLVRRSRRM